MMLVMGSIFSIGGFILCVYNAPDVVFMGFAVMGMICLVGAKIIEAIKETK